MEYRKLNRTELRVSRLCFGAMTFGKPADQATATCMVDRCLDAGINFFDTANAYQHGESEQMLGNAIRGRRHDLVIASKVHHKMFEGPDGAGLSKAAIVRALEDSLKRLQTDYLDVYYFHQPDNSVPLEESLEAIDALARQGKVRYLGLSNYSSWQVCQMHWVADQHKYDVPVISQPMYNLVARGCEQEFLPMAKQLGVSTVVYNPLAGGLLTGKYSPESITPATRFATNPVYVDRYWHPHLFKSVDALKKLAADAGRSLPSLAFNWLLHHTATDCLILGASRLEQLDANLRACEDGPLPADAVTECDNIWDELRGPAPVYNR